MVYYSHFGLNNYDPNVGIFQYLGMAAFNYRSNTFTAINFELDQSRQILEYSPKTSDVSALTISILIAFLLILPVIL